MYIAKTYKKAFKPTIPPGNGTKCAIVGNAQSLFDKGQGELIDTFPVVVRINQPAIKDSTHQGSKTSAVFCHDASARHTSRLWRLQQFIQVNISSDIVSFTNKWTEQLIAETNNEKARPTTGFVALMYMREQNYDVTLFGFDWYKTNTYYTNAGAYIHHYVEWEEKIVREVLLPEQIQ